MQAARAAASGAGIQIKPLSKWFRSTLRCCPCPPLYVFAQIPRFANFQRFSVYHRSIMNRNVMHERPVSSCARDTVLCVITAKHCAHSSMKRCTQYFVVKSRVTSSHAESGRPPSAWKHHKSKRSEKDCERP